MPRDSKLKAGDIVQLKSGGPEMTIIELLGSTMVVCQWFSVQPRECTFINDALELSMAKDPVQKAKEMRIKAGDMVKFKSGGPTMTVRVIENFKAVCQWFITYANPYYDEILYEGSFPRDALHGSAILRKMEQERLQKMEHERLQKMEHERLQKMEHERRKAAITYQYDPEVDGDDPEYDSYTH